MFSKNSLSALSRSSGFDNDIFSPQNSRLLGKLNEENSLKAG
jgi:hypothetical protein